LANDGLDFVGFLRFMPALELNEIPRCAGQYFRTVSVHGNIIFDANSTDTRRIYSRFNRDYVPGLQASLLSTRHPGIFVNFEPQAVPCAMDEKVVQAVTCQDLPRRSIYVPTGRTRLRSGDCRLLGLQNRLIPRSDALWSPPHIHCAGNVAAIVAEYNTQVQHDQLIFPQSLGRGASMRKRGPFSKSDDSFERRAGRSPLSHLVFDLGAYFKFSNAGFQHANRVLDHIVRQNSRSAHLRQFWSILAHPQAFDPARRRNPAYPRASCSSEALELPNRDLGGIESYALERRVLQELAGRLEQGAFLLDDSDPRRLRSALHDEPAVGDQTGALP